MDLNLARTFVLVAEARSFTEHAQRAVAELGEGERGPVAADDMQLAQQLVEHGAGIGTLIFAPGMRTTLHRGLVRLLPEYIVQGPRLCLATTSKKNLPLRVTLLRQFLIDAYAEVNARTALSASGSR